VFEELLFDCFIPCPSALIKRDLFFKVGGIDSSLKVAEDYDIFLKVAEISDCHAVDQILCTYRIHANNLSHTNLDTTFNESIAVVTRYKHEKNFEMYLIYWRLKYLKNLFKNKNYYNFLINLKIINIYYFVLMVFKRCL
jgi:hypothetical protein